MRSVTLPSAAALIATILGVSSAAAQINYSFTRTDLSVDVPSDSGPQALAMRDIASPTTVDNPRANVVDQRPDLLVAERDGHDVAVFTNNGDGTFDDFADSF